MSIHSNKTHEFTMAFEFVSSTFILVINDVYINAENGIDSTIARTRSAPRTLY